MSEASLHRAIGDRLGIAHPLEEIAWIAARHDTPAHAARLFAAAEALRRAIGSPLAPIERERHESAVADVRGTLGESAFAIAWATGAAITPDDAIAFAIVSTDPHRDVQVASNE